MTFNMVTANDAHAQGLHPSAFLSIAMFHDRAGNGAIAGRARRVAVDLAGLRGERLVGRGRVPHNDNRKAQTQRRRAATRTRPFRTAAAA